MNQEAKKNILEKAKDHVKRTRTDIAKQLQEILKSIENLDQEVRASSSGDIIIKERLVANLRIRVEELKGLEPSPYFFRCDVIFEDEPEEKKPIYFAKFQFSENSIFSWTSRVSAIRFESPGEIKYQLRNGSWRKGQLLRKDQFMIVNGKIMFMASESLDYERTLIHQEKLQRRKSDFVLPEIIELMEKAQDKVIRADYKGPFLISGPAGSGKTTLALHRVAYLLQSPDTMDKFNPNNMIVFVQDESTKNYFSHLLLDLGASRVTITTFSEWVFDKLGIKDHKYVERIGQNEAEKDLYEYNKRLALRGAGDVSVSYSDKYFDILENIYCRYLDKSQFLCLKQQRKNFQFDRFDLAILLKIFVEENNGLLVEQIFHEQLKNGNYRKRKIMGQLDYSLIVLDEIQNYIAEQIKILRGLVNRKTQAIIYVGDLRQQTHLGTVSEWVEVGEYFDESRKVVLNKVYRNTQNILKYINGLGYSVDIPSSLGEGSVVEEHVFSTKEEEIYFVKREIEKLGSSGVIGILAKYGDYIKDYEILAEELKNIKVMTINDAQGVEFDTVFLVGINHESYLVPENYANDLAREVQRVNKDLIYVALTRAMNKLYVVGSVSLKDVVSELL